MEKKGGFALAERRRKTRQIGFLDSENAKGRASTGREIRKEKDTTKQTDERKTLPRNASEDKRRREKRGKGETGNGYVTRRNGVYVQYDWRREGVRKKPNGEAPSFFHSKKHMRRKKGG